MLGGAALIVFGTGLILSNPMVRRYLGQLGVGNLMQAALPDVDAISQIAEHVETWRVMGPARNQCSLRRRQKGEPVHGAGVFGRECCRPLVIVRRSSSATFTAEADVRPRQSGASFS